MAQDVNHVVLIGRLTHDVGADERSFGYTPSGAARANVSIAVNRSRKSGDQWVEEVSYFEVTIWGKQAESLKPYLTKGKQIGVEGYLRQERWEKDGQKRSKITIVATNVQLLGGNSGNEQGNTSGTPKFVPANNTSSNGSQEDFGNMDYGDVSDIPF